MESLSESTEMIRMKRKYGWMTKEDTMSFGGETRQMLTFDSEETPAKSKKPMVKTNKHTDSISKSKDSVTMRRELLLKDAEIISLQTSKNQMKDRLSSSDLASQQRVLEAEKSMSKMRADRERDANKMSEMHSKLQYVMEREKDARETIRQLEKENGRYKSEMDKKMDQLQMEKREIEDKAHAQKQKWQEKESNLHDELIQQKKNVIKLESLYGESQTFLALRDKQIIENKEKQQDVDDIKRELKVSRERVQTLESELAEHGDNIVITKALKKDLDLVPKMKSDLERLTLDNEQLRHNEQNCLLLEEEVRSLKQRLELAEMESKRVIELEVANEELQGRLSRWEVHDTSGSRRPQSPSSLSRRVMELETALAMSKLREGELQTQINSIKCKLEQSRTEGQKLSSELGNEKNIISQNNDTIKRLKRKVLLLSKERDSFKNLLDSYESEVTLNINAERQAHSQRQEEMLHEYRIEVGKLETEITHLTERISATQGKLEVSQQQLNVMKSPEKSMLSTQHEREIRQAREQIAEFEIRLAKTESERDILEARIEQRYLQGDYDPSKTKVIHIKWNPCAMAQEARQTELENMREELDALRKRNQILEEQGGAVEDLTIQVREKLQQPSPSKEIEELKSQLKKEELRNKRLMEVFTKKGQEFRDICYVLTGYKIDNPCDNQYRLTSMYAESSRDYLLFQQNQEGKIQMLETDFSTAFKEDMEIYLQQRQSIPLFLSHITMSLFSRQTLH